MVQAFDREGRLLYYFGQRGMVLDNSSCPPDWRSTTAITSTSWTPLIHRVEVFHYFATAKTVDRAKPMNWMFLRLRRAPLAGALAFAQVPVPDVLGMHNLSLTQRSFRLFARKLGLHVLPCAAQRTRSDFVAMESDVFEGDLHSVQQHDLRRARQQVSRLSESPTAFA